MKTFLVMAALASVSAAAAQNHGSAPLSYPTPPQSDTVDDYFGIKVSDPYRPLENDTAAATLAWVDAENAVTEAYLAAIPFRGEIRARLARLADYVKTGLPWKGNDGRYYYFENDGLKNQSVLYRADSIGGVPEVFLDPNTLSDDGTVALTGVFQSDNGRYTAYTISRSGSDWTEIYVLDTETGRLLDDHILWAKFTGAEWDGNGFYYSAYQAPEAGKEFSNANVNHRVYYHEIGTSQSADRLVFEDTANPLHFHSISTVEGAPDLLVVYKGGQGVGQGMLVFDKKNPGKGWTVIEPTQNFNHSVIGADGDRLYILTSMDAPRMRLMTAPVSNPAKENWKELVGERPAVLKEADFSGSDILLLYEKDASNYVDVIGSDGSRKGGISLPGYGSVGLSASKKHPEVFYNFTSFTSPSAIYEFDKVSGSSRLLKRPEVEGVDFDDYITEQVFYPSADGTKVPMFLTYKKGMKRDGKNPVYLYGYGGFNVSLTPGFSPYRMLWLENGGIYAQTNLRGGSEYGEEWHEAGTKLNKLNVFNDFIAAAEYLTKEGYTSPDYIALEGGSNGGLLVGATVNLRPDIAKVAIPRVGVMDMMRYHLFTIGWNWASDYGTSADSEEMARYLAAYSPAHNIRNDGTPYPAILVTTADHDDRVVPAHSFKYAAALQGADTGDAPKLIRIDSKAGHGAGKPISKVIDEYADIYSFIFHNMGLAPKTQK